MIVRGDLVNADNDLRDVFRVVAQGKEAPLMLVIRIFINLADAKKRQLARMHDFIACGKYRRRIKRPGNII